MRIFVAIPFPQHIKTLLSEQFDPALKGANWERAAGLHMTLRFIGSVDDATYARYQTVLESIQQPAFDLQINSVGCFPEDPARFPRILWAGVTQPSELMTLQRAIYDGLDAAGLKPDRHPDYNPHITLARMKSETQKAQFAQYLADYADLTSEVFRVTEFAIFNSGRGGIFTPIVRYPLLDM
ncbi:MAG: RNA 2',3'-cyclic phosphodiesterase [Aggregatilineales bacterium]